MVSCTCSLDEQAICQGWQDSNLSWLNEVHLRVPTRSPTAVLYNHLNPSLSENPSSGHAAPLAQVAPQGHACKLTDVAGIFFWEGAAPGLPFVREKISGNTPCQQTRCQNIYLFVMVTEVSAKSAGEMHVLGRGTIIHRRQLEPNTAETCTTASAAFYLTFPSL